MAGIMDPVAPPAADPNAAQQPAPQQAPQQPDDAAQGDQDPSTNQAYQDAMEVVMDALYKKGGAKDVAKAMNGAQPAQALADTAYQIVQVADERTNGEVPDELLASLATDVLTEVAEVAEAAGIKVDGNVVADALQIMITRFLKEQGVDPSQLQQAMSQMNQGGQFGQLLDKAAEQKD